MIDPVTCLPPARPMLLAPLADADWPAAIAPLRDGFAGTLNVYRTMAHHPALLVAWQGLRHHVVIDGALPADLREIAILRVGHRWQARYEWGQHIVRGRAAGLDDARIAACAGDGTTGDDRLVVDAVDALLARGALDPAQVAALTEALGLHGVFDLMATVGMYTTLAFVANSFGTPLEPAIAVELGLD